PAIRSAVVSAQPNPSGHKRLVAYIVTDSQPGPQSGELRSYLRERLPDYMVPTAFMKVDALPLDRNGKVRRQALPAPERAAFNPDGDYVTPHTYLEKTIATIWEQVLGLDKVGANQNFFDLGGDSLLILQVHSKLCEELGHDFSMITMFR